MNGVPAQRWRLVFRRRSDAPLQSQRDAASAWEEAVAGADLPLVTVEQEGVRPRLAFGAPVGGAIASEADLVDLWVTERLPVARVREALAGSLPEGHELVSLHDVWLGEAALPGRVVAADLEAELRTLAGPEALRAAAREMLAAPALPRERVKADRIVRYDLRPLVIEVQILERQPDGAGGAEPAQGVVARMRLAHDSERGIGRPEEVVAELAGRVGAPIELGSIVRLRLLLREDIPRDGGGPAQVREGRPGGRRPAAPR